MMQSSDQISLNSGIKLDKPILPKYDYGYWLIVFFSLVMFAFIAAQVFSLIEKDEITLVGNSLKTVIGIVGILMSYSVTKSLEGDLKHTWKILTWALLSNLTKSKSFDKKKFLGNVSIVMVSGVARVRYFIIHSTISGITEEDYISPALNLS